jgi:hypothetical protein
VEQDFWRQIARISRKDKMGLQNSILDDIKAAMTQTSTGMNAIRKAKH